MVHPHSQPCFGVCPCLAGNSEDLYTGGGGGVSFAHAISTNHFGFGSMANR